MPEFNKNFEDPRIDIEKWKVKPSEELQAVVGDLSDPNNITYERAIAISWKAKDYIKLGKAGTDFLESTSVDRIYAINAFSFVVDKLFSSGALNPDDARVLEVLQARNDLYALLNSEE